MASNLLDAPVCSASFFVPAVAGTVPTLYEQFDCEVNSIDIEELFDRYGEIGFLYPEKLKRLAPFMPTIIENWRRAMDAGDAIHRVVTCDQPAAGAWASISSWRTTTTGWSSQHLVSAGNPIASRAVMLSYVGSTVDEVGHESNQNWFRPDNRMPKRIFGSIVESLGEENAAVDCFNYVEVTPLAAEACVSQFQVVECTAATQAELYELAVETRGKVYAQAEELDGDLNLTELDEVYQEVGLRRYRRVWLARDKSNGRVVAALVAYRGPLGFNFSFLENRADLLIRDEVADEQLGQITAGLIAAASAEYADFEPGFIPVIADDRAARALELRGDKIVRQYCQSIWLKEGYAAWCEHTEGFYERIMSRLARHSEPKAAA
jgi:hypothetical protein